MTNWYEQQPWTKNNTEAMNLKNNKVTKISQHLRFNRDEPIEITFFQHDIEHTFRGYIEEGGITSDANASLTVTWNQDEIWIFRGWLRVAPGTTHNVYFSKGTLTIMKRVNHQIKRNIEIKGEWNSKDIEQYHCSTGSINVFDDDGNKIVESYRGEFSGGKYHGLGVLKFRIKNPTSRDDQPPSYTQFTYRGQFENNMFKGFGKLTTTRQSKDQKIQVVFQGEWIDSMPRVPEQVLKNMKFGYTHFRIKNISQGTITDICRIATGSTNS